MQIEAVLLNPVNEKTGRIKKAELLSGIGAVVFGIGLGLLLSSFLNPYALHIFFTGLVMHIFGMFEKHRLESASTGVWLWWAEALYWACWILLLLLAAYIVIAYMRR